MARRYDNTDTDADLICDWESTGLLNSRVIRSHRAPQTSLSRKVLISATSIFMLTTGGVTLNTYVNRHNIHTMHARIAGDELSSIDDATRQLRVEASSRDAVRPPHANVPSFTPERARAGARPHIDVRHQKHSLVLPSYIPR